MQTYLVMGQFTDQGIKNVRETTVRADRFRQIAKECGVKVREIMWLMGDYDVINIVEAADEESLAALLLKVGAWGNVKTTTYRAFSKSDMEAVIAKMNGS